VGKFQRIYKNLIAGVSLFTALPAEQHENLAKVK
jgi:hypothetical protein